MSNHFISQLNTYFEKGLINAKLKNIIQDSYVSYQKALENAPAEEDLQRFEQFIALVIKEIQQPHPFSIFHQSIRQPFDYYQFGLDFIRPFIDFQHSKIMGIEFIQAIQDQIQKGENVILLANHQTEPDPQIISLLLEKIDGKLASEMIFLAGHRVISDPMAIPMSLGRNLLCIYSKKHLSSIPEIKAKQVQHNQQTLKKMQELLNQGGYCIYVAPSGGRDRPNAAGQVEVDVFDPNSIELFWIIGQRAQRPTHFYPLALKTYRLMPPPQVVEKEIGERRIIHRTPVGLAFGPEIHLDSFSGSEPLDKKTTRTQRADYVWNQVRQQYASLN